MFVFDQLYHFIEDARHRSLKKLAKRKRPQSQPRDAQTPLSPSADRAIYTPMAHPRSAPSTAGGMMSVEGDGMSFDDGFGIDASQSLFGESSIWSGTRSDTRGRKRDTKSRSSGRGSGTAGSVYGTEEPDEGLRVAIDVSRCAIYKILCTLFWFDLEYVIVISGHKLTHENGCGGNPHND